MGWLAGDYVQGPTRRTAGRGLCAAWCLELGVRTLGCGAVSRKCVRACVVGPHELPGATLGYREATMLVHKEHSCVLCLSVTSSCALLTLRTVDAAQAWRRRQLPRCRRLCCSCTAAAAERHYCPPVPAATPSLLQTAAAVVAAAAASPPDKPRRRLPRPQAYGRPNTPPQQHRSRSRGAAPPTPAGRLPRCARPLCGRPRSPSQSDWQSTWGAPRREAARGCPAPAPRPHSRR